MNKYIAYKMYYMLKFLPKFIIPDDDARRNAKDTGYTGGYSSAESGRVAS